MFTQVPLASLPIGAKFSVPVFDQRRTKLIGAGLEITSQLVESLRKRCVDKVVVAISDMGRAEAFKPQGRANSTHADRGGCIAKLENDHSRQLDRLSETAPAGAIQKSDNPLSLRIHRPGVAPLDADRSREMADRNERQIESLDAMAAACLRGDGANLELIRQISEQTIEDVVEDVDATAGLGANPYTHSYPSRHSQHVAMLAIAVGTTAGLDDKSLIELGVGCLIHDIGMLAIDRRMYESRAVIADGDFVEIAKHPLKTFDIIEENVDAVPVVARMVAYQIHERCNGNGYPRRREAAQTHPLARLAAVADAYAALVAPRPHRAGMIPYCAMEKMLKDVAAGRFDGQAVRALLQTLGLFPLGSYVGLNDDYVGRVIRANGQDFTRPVLEVWHRSARSAPPSLVDLSQEPRLKVEKPLAHFAA